MARYDEIRYLTKDRFDQIEKGMSQEEVTAITGVPYFRNRRTDEERGVQYWLFERRDGGVSAIYFDKKGNVYSTKYDAVKPKISE
jgi:outer membrane protein assembly factor BamE (lipoprotein component of BamABCDE complex)